MESEICFVFIYRVFIYDKYVVRLMILMIISNSQKKTKYHLQFTYRNYTYAEEKYLIVNLKYCLHE